MKISLAKKEKFAEVKCDMYPLIWPVMLDNVPIYEEKIGHKNVALYMEAENTSNGVSKH